MSEESQQSRTCPNCGRPIDIDDRFCRHCGAPVQPALEDGEPESRADYPTQQIEAVEEHPIEGPEPPIAMPGPDEEPALEAESHAEAGDAEEPSWAAEDREEEPAETRSEWVEDDWRTRSESGAPEPAAWQPQTFSRPSAVASNNRVWWIVGAIVLVFIILCCCLLIAISLVASTDNSLHRELEDAALVASLLVS